MACATCEQARRDMWDNFKAWLRQPYSADMSAAGWFAFFGLIIVITVLWGFILKHITEGIEA